MKIGRRSRAADASNANGTRLKIAYYSDPSSPNGWYRASGPMAALAGRGHEIRQLAPTRRRARLELLPGCDVVHIHRQHDETAQLILRWTRENGVPLTWDNDDALEWLPKSNVGARKFSGLHGTRAIKVMHEMTAAADVVTTPSAVLAARFMELGAKEARVIENHPDDRLPMLRRGAAGGRLVIGWVAGMEHQLDVDQIPIVDALGRILEAHPRVDLRTIGLGLPLKHERYTHIPGIEFDRLPAATAEFDIGLAPLTDIPFNRCRSNIKVKEYAALGIPWLASPIGPYTDLDERRAGGRLVADDAWFQSIDTLIRDPGEFKRLTRRASGWGVTQTIGHNVAPWERLMLELAERGGGG